MTVWVYEEWGYVEWQYGCIRNGGTYVEWQYGCMRNGGTWNGSICKCVLHNIVPFSGGPDKNISESLQWSAPSHLDNTRRSVCVCVCVCEVLNESEVGQR